MTTSSSNDPRTSGILSAAIEVHRELGPGLLESAYFEALCSELDSRGVEFAREVYLPVHYKGVALDCNYRIDLLVQDETVVEIKSVEQILAVHEAQLLTYMRLSRKALGLLLNFNVPLLKQGVIRRVL